VSESGYHPKFEFSKNLSETGYQMFNEIGYQLKEDFQDFYSDKT
jgi:hypothetical protein